MQQLVLDDLENEQLRVNKRGKRWAQILDRLKPGDEIVMSHLDATRFRTTVYHNYYEFSVKVRQKDKLVSICKLEKRGL